MKELLTVQENERCVSFEVPRAVYSDDALRIANTVFASRAEVYLTKSRSLFALTLKSRRTRASAAELTALGGDFLNELLNQEYRFLVGRFNGKISRLISTQALYAARGAAETIPPPAAEASAQFKAESAELLRQAEEEVSRTMPKKIPSQGAPLPPAAEDAVA